ncbi:MAG: hypothetical protein ABL940_08245 [Bacteroidia bacterium]
MAGLENEKVNLRRLTDEARALNKKISGKNANEDFVRAEYEMRNLKKELHRQTFTIWYDVTRRFCFVADDISTMSSCAKIACMKQLIKWDIVNNDANWIKDE